MVSEWNFPEKTFNFFWLICHCKQQWIGKATKREHYGILWEHDVLAAYSFLQSYTFFHVEDMVQLRQSRMTIKKVNSHTGERGVTLMGKISMKLRIFFASLPHSYLNVNDV